MLKKFFTILTLVVFLGVSTEAQKIAIVDINNVLESLEDYQLAQAEIDKVASEWRQEISQNYDNIKSLYNKYQAEQVLLSEEVKTQRENEIMEAEAKVRELQKRRFGPEGDLFLRRQEIVAPIQDKVFSAIEDFAADRGYDLIFDKSGSAGILFVGEEYDKTEDIRKRLKIK